MNCLSVKPGRLDFLSMVHPRAQKTKIPEELYKSLDGMMFTLIPASLFSF